MFIDPESFNAFIVFAVNIQERYFSGSAEIAEAWFKKEYPNVEIIGIVCDSEYNSFMWGKI